MGKGGVGKTTVAAAVAVALAKRGYPVHSDDHRPGGPVAASQRRVPNLRVSRIDPRASRRLHRRGDGNAGQGLDEQGKALLEEDLRSPCTEEIAVFRAFAGPWLGARTASLCSIRRPRPHDSAARRGWPTTVKSQEASGMPESVESCCRDSVTRTSPAS